VGTPNNRAGSDGMTDFKPFLPSQATELFPAGDAGDYILPICMPEMDLMAGEDMAVIVFTTVDDQRVGVPLELDALSALYAVIGEALLRMQAPEGGSVQ
jgi:hypothetical protein